MGHFFDPKMTVRIWGQFGGRFWAIFWAPFLDPFFWVPFIFRSKKRSKLEILCHFMGLKMTHFLTTFWHLFVDFRHTFKRELKKGGLKKWPKMAIFVPLKIAFWARNPRRFGPQISVFFKKVTFLRFWGPRSTPSRHVFYRPVTTRIYR